MSTRHVHRIPVEADFIEPIGEAVCVCQYLDDALHCIGRCLSTTFYGHNEGKSSGTLTRNLKALVEQCDIAHSLRSDLLELCEQATTIFRGRNEVVHSKGYTKSDGNQSRLYRSSRSAHYNYLSPDKIKKFTEEAAAVACRANALLHDARMPSGESTSPSA